MQNGKVNQSSKRILTICSFMLIFFMLTSCSSKNAAEGIDHNGVSSSPKPTITVTTEKSDATSKGSSAEPVYNSNSRLTDEGLQDDYVYHFINGDILNPQVGEPLLLLNGSFSTKALGLIQWNVVYVPLSDLVEAFGGTTNWDAEKSEIVYQMNDITIDVVWGTYGVAKKATLNGEKCEAPLNVDNEGYVSIAFINKYMNLDAGYLSAPGVSIAENPVIWVDTPGTYKLYDQASGENLNWLKTQLNQGLENYTKSSSEHKTPEDAKRAAPEIAFDIEHTVYLGQAGRYAMYDGVKRVILVDTRTKDIYFYDAENAYGSISKVDLNDPDLYSMKYLFG